MASGEKSRRLSRFLDFIGLVDPEKQGDKGEETSSRRTRTARTPAKTTRPAEPEDDMDNLFDDEPAPRPRTTGYIQRTGTQPVRRTAGTGRYPSAAPQEPYRTSAPQSRYPGARQQSTIPYAGPETLPRVAPEDEYSQVVEGGRRNPYRTGTAASRWQEPAYENYGNPQYEPQSPVRHQVLVMNLSDVRQCKDVIDALLGRRSVLVSLVGMSGKDAQRALDIMSGATLALSAHISEASATTWLIAPSNVEVDDKKREQQSPYGQYN